MEQRLPISSSQNGHWRSRYENVCGLRSWSGAGRGAIGKLADLRGPVFQHEEGEGPGQHHDAADHEQRGLKEYCAVTGLMSQGPAAPTSATPT